MNKWTVLIDGKEIMNFDLEEHLVHEDVWNMALEKFRTIELPNSNHNNMKYYPFRFVSLVKTLPNNGVKTWLYTI